MMKKIDLLKKIISPDIIDEESVVDDPFITEAKDKNGDRWYHQIVLEQKNKIIYKAIKYLMLHSNYVEDIGRCCDELNDDECTELLNILLGADKE